MDERCPVCGDAADYCLGHAGDPVAVRIIINHHKGRHRACSPTGCDEAFDAAISRIIEAQQSGTRCIKDWKEIRLP